MTNARNVIGRFDAPLLALRLADTESAEVQRCSESARNPVGKASQSVVQSPRQTAGNSPLQANPPPRPSYDGPHSHCTPVCGSRKRRGPRPGNDGLLRGTNVNGHIQNVLYLCGCCDLLRRSDFRRNPHDVGTVSGCDPRTLRALFGAGVLGWGAGWIGSLTGQSM